MAVPISNVTRRAVYAPSGAGGVGPYAFTFEILANTDIAVYKDDVLLTLTTHYTVTINANGTGSVTITAAGLALSPTSPTQYAIVGNRTIARATDFTTGGDFFANTINDELDQQTIFAQQNAEGLQRALTAPQTDPTTIDMTLPKAADRANKTLAFDSNGDPTLGISAADVANAVTYATNAANSATAAASSASSASSSASAASASASTASTQASNASTSATNASNSASSASTSATNAAASASTATTQASNASTSATNAASSASAASTSASNAATSETNAAASASTASTQASNASTSASNASTSATNAASSAAAAASALDSFDDRYLGSKSSDPTLDNDGNALLTGALYYNTTTQTMKVYDGANWITATAAGTTALLVYKYVATAGQTTFSGAASVGGTLSYTSNNIIVFVNGVSLDSTDYTATNGTSVVLASGASLNDEVVIVAFKSFTVADTYTKGEVDAFAVKLTGAQTVAGVKTFSSEPVFSAGIALASGQGINFGASSNAAGMTSETLNDYEEGTWTPTVTASGSNPTVTYNTQAGTYVKVGKNVFITVDVRWNTLSGGSGNVNVSGLPFTSNAYYSTSVVAEKSGANLTSSGNILTVETNISAASLVFLQTIQTGASSGYAVGNLGSTGYLIFSMSYVSAS